MSFMDFSALGRLPDANDPCPPGHAAMSDHERNQREIKDGIEEARQTLQNGLRVLSAVADQAAQIDHPQTGLLEDEVYDGQGAIESALIELDSLESKIREREVHHLSRAGYCMYASYMYQESVGWLREAQTLARTTLQRANVRGIQARLERIVQQVSAAEAQRAAERAAIEARELAQRQAAEERALEEQRFLEAQQAQQADREAQRAAQVQLQIEAERQQYELRKAEIDARSEAEAEERAWQREQLDRQMAIEEARLVPQKVTVEEGPPPAWMQELLSVLALQAGPPKVPMATAPPVAAPEVFAYSPSGQPIDAFGNPIPTSYAPVSPAPPVPAVPGYYTPWNQTAAQAPSPPVAPALPGSPFQLQTFVPSGSELFGLQGLGQSAYAGPGGKLMVQADELEARAAGLQAADPTAAAALRQQASALRTQAQAMAAEEVAAEAPVRGEAAKAGPGVLDSISKFIRELTPEAERAYDVYTGRGAPPPPTKKTPIMQWLLPIGLVGAAVWGVSKLVKK